MLAFKPHKGAIFQVAFSPDGASIATCGTRPILCVSDAATGKALWQCSHGPSIGLGLAYSPDGTQLAVVDWDAVRIFSTATGDESHKYPGRGYAVAFTPDGFCVVTGHDRLALDAIRTIVKSGHAKRITAFNGNADFNRLRFSPDGRFLAALGSSTLDVLDVERWKGGAEATLSHPTAGVGALAWHPNDRIIVYSDGPKLIAFAWESRSRIAERVRSKKYIQDATFTPDGKHLITVSNDTTAVLWETAGWTTVQEFAWEIGPLKSVAITPDGSRAVCGSDRGRVVVWDLDA